MYRKSVGILLLVVTVILWQETIPLMGNGTPPFWLHRSSNFDYSSQITPTLIVISLLALISLGCAMWLLIGKIRLSIIITAGCGLLLGFIAFIVSLSYITF